MARGGLQSSLRATTLALLAALSGQTGPAAATWVGPQPALCGYALYLPLLMRGGAGSAMARRGAFAANSPADFNGDGCADLAIGIPSQTVSGQFGAGAFQVLYGSLAGLQVQNNQQWHQAVPGVAGGVEQYDFLGRALAAGDFDGDGITDVAAGAPGEAVGVEASAGAVNVLYGSTAGITVTANQQWHQDVTGMLGAAEPNDLLGAALAVGDFDGDGYADLAIGAPGEGVGSAARAGAVNVLYGSAAGLAAPGNQLWYAGAAGLVGQPVAEAKFGDALAAGDFDRDGYDDLAIGARHETRNDLFAAGAVYLLYGTVNGLSATGAQRWDQASPDVFGSVEEDDNFGAALAAGDFDGDGYGDLAIGSPAETFEGVDFAGVAHVLYGSAGGLTGAGSTFIAETSAGMDGEAERADNFGYALAAGDFNADSVDDLAICIQGEAVSGADNAGAVVVVYGATSGLSTAGHQRWDQSTAGAGGLPEPGTFFGRGLIAGDYDGDGGDDLAIGAPYADVGSQDDAGAVHVLYSTPAGLTAGNAQYWHGDSAGLEGEATAYAHFGSKLR